MFPMGGFLSPECSVLGDFLKPPKHLVVYGFAIWPFLLRVVKRKVAYYG